MKLQSQNLTKKYSNKIAVQNLSINLIPGEILGLLGPNGAGKTTFFYMIAGLITSDSGKILSSEMKLDKHSLLRQQNEEKFCSDVVKRKKMRREFDRSLGKVRYVNVERENITQIVTYINSKSIFVTIEPELTITSKELLISKIKKIVTNLKWVVINFLCLLPIKF